MSPAAAGKCGKCGAQLDAGAPEGLCPACLFNLGMEPTQEMIKPKREVEHGPAVPLEVLEDARSRMGWIGLALAVTSAGIYLTGSHVEAGWIDPAAAPGSYRLGVLMTALTGLGLFALARARMVPTLLALDLGLVLECAAGLFISLSENAVPRLEGEVIRGNSSVAVWIAIFALAVPASFGKAMLASMATASMGPIGLAIQVVLKNVPTPPASYWFVQFSANFLLAFGAALLSKLIYGLGAQVKEAREYGGYELLHPIAHGGMGEVWFARHRLIGREAALKLIYEGARVGTPKRSDLRKRFGREARATASLHSPHTVSLYGYGISEQSVPYYIMELLDGLDLESLVRRFGPVPAPRAIAILLQVCDSLAEAHDAGLTHRDIKPRNIMLCRLGVNTDFVKVLDFGLVKFFDAGKAGLSSGVIVGTPDFISPEAAVGLPVDARTDLYGAGCVAYWMLTGKHLFEASTPMAAALAHVKDAPAPPSQRTENPIPAELERVVMACLAKNPADRPQSARELARWLRRAAGETWIREQSDDWWRVHVPDRPADTPLPGTPL